MAAFNGAGAKISMRPFDKAGFVYKESLDILKSWSERYLRLTADVLEWYKGDGEQVPPKKVSLKRVTIVSKDIHLHSTPSTIHPFNITTTATGECQQKSPSRMKKGSGFCIVVDGLKPIYNYFYVEDEYERALWIQYISHNISLLTGGYLTKEEKEVKKREVMGRIEKYNLKLVTKEGEVLLYTGAMLTPWEESYIVLTGQSFTVYKSKGGKILYQLPRLAGCKVMNSEQAPKGLPVNNSFQVMNKYEEPLYFYCAIEEDRKAWISFFGNNVIFDEAGYHEKFPPPAPTTTDSPPKKGPKLRALSVEEAKVKLERLSAKDIKAFATPLGVNWTGCLSKEDIVEKALASEAVREKLSDA